MATHFQSRPGWQWSESSSQRRTLGYFLKAQVMQSWDLVGKPATSKWWFGGFVNELWNFQTWPECFGEQPTCVFSWNANIYQLTPPLRLSIYWDFPCEVERCCFDYFHTVFLYKNGEHSGVLSLELFGKFMRDTAMKNMWQIYPEFFSWKFPEWSLAKPTRVYSLAFP